MDDPLLVSGTDGVGTKLKLRPRWPASTTRRASICGLCANDILATGAEPLFFLDYVAIGKLPKAENVAEIVAGIGEGCKQASCALIGDGRDPGSVMDPDDYDLSGFCVGVVDRAKMLDPAAVREGDVLIGLASSGLHSNGYSLARKVCVEGKTHYELRIEREELGGAACRMRFGPRASQNRCAPCWTQAPARAHRRISEPRPLRCRGCAAGGGRCRPSRRSCATRRTRSRRMGLGMVLIGRR